MSKLEKKFPVYIPAGSHPSENKDPLLVKTNVTNKALIEINGKTLIDYVLEVVDESKYVDRIIIVGIAENDVKYKTKHPIEFVPSVGSRMDTLRTLIKYLEDVYDEMPEQILIFSADIPLITTEMIDNIIETQYEERGDDFDKIDYYYPLVRKDKVLAKFPEANKRFRTFTEGSFATGDFHILSPYILQNEETMGKLEKIINNRKTILKLLFKFDIFAPIKYLLGRLSAEKQVIPFLAGEFDIRIELMIVDHPEIVIDLDYPEDLEIMAELLKNKS